jgi:hypothetical protein
MARNLAGGFPRCSDIYAALIKDAPKSEARRPTENPACGMAAKFPQFEAQVFWAWGMVLQSRGFRSALEKRETMKLG